MSAEVLSPGVLGWIEDVTGGRVVNAQQVPAGGRAGYFVDVEIAGATKELFLQRGSRAGVGSFSGFEREAEVCRALESLEIPVPHIWAVDEPGDVLLADRAPGTTWFQAPRDENEAVAVARDFMSHLARWHRTPAAKLGLPSFAPIKTVPEHQRDQLAAIGSLFAAEEAQGPIDVLASAQLDFLRSHVPDYDGDPVLVQGDTGPGNFLYQDGRVTAIVDWELAHIGDPMDDIAWLSWRATQHGWPDFAARIRDYETLSGNEVDPVRVAYYRLNACARLGPLFGLVDMGTRPGIDPARSGAGSDAAVDRAADGSGMVMTMLHRRMRLTAQADALGLDLPGREVSGEGEVRPHAALYDAVLGQLRGIAERSPEGAVLRLTKGAARQIKYLKEIDRNGTLFEAQELEDLGRLLHRRPASLEEGRAALAERARKGRVGLEDYLLYHWSRLVRDDWLMRPASGALYDRSWPDLR